MLLLNIPSSVLGQEKDSIHFRVVTFEQALEMARAEKKPVFLHGYASWCHYCSEMTEQVYTDKEVADFFNARFVTFPQFWFISIPLIFCANR
jgi:thiol:disulfide interchange protein